MVYGRKSKFDNLYLQICKKWELPFKEIEIQLYVGTERVRKMKIIPKR
jgi:hypothetical protein